MANTIPSTASTLATLDVAGLRRTAWDTKYKQDSVRPSVFSALKTDFKVMQNGEVIITKPGILLDVSNIGKSAVGGGQSVVISLRKPLTAAPREGTGSDMLGNEDESDLLYCTLYYNEIKKAIKFNQWGYDKNDLDYLKYNEGYSGLMGTYWQELDDYRYQMALLMRYSSELTATPTSRVQTFNPNWAVPNVVEASYPTWDVDAITQTNGVIDTTMMPDGVTSIGYYPDMYFSGVATFVETIAAALISGAGTGATSKATLTISAMLQIAQYVVDQHVVEPLIIGGQPMYVWKMPPKVYFWMMNSAKSGSLGAWWADVATYNDKQTIVFPGEIGMFGGNMKIVLDTRCPTLTVGGAAGSYTLTPGYIRPGNIDERDNGAWSATSGATKYVFDITTIMGAQAIAKYTRDELKMGLVQMTEYEKRQGRGSYKGEGIQLPLYDKGTATTTTGIYRGSLVVPVSRDPIQTIS